jgi:serpin B
MVRMAQGLAVVLACSLIVIGGVAYHFLGPAEVDRSAGQPRPETPGPLGGRADDNGSTPGDLAFLGDATNLFALEMFANLSGDGGNVFFSPYSMEAAFGMLYEGARGKTADEIRTVFHFAQNDTARRSSFAAFYNRYNIDSEDYSLSTANAVWIQNNYPVLAQYLGVLARYYMAGAANLDFSNAPEQARKTINDWVANQTAGRITDLFPPGSINSMTLLALTNAIYFKGDWVTKFDSKKTKAADFYTANGPTVQVKMMRIPSGDGFFNFTHTDGVQILRLPYAGDRLSMLFLLPDEYNTKALEKKLTPANLTKWRGELRREELEIKIPRFELKCRYDLKETLNQMGMPSVFGAADFSGMTGKKDLFVGSAVHQAWINVNEEGTEAAAATGIGMMGGMPPSFNADHPFIFMIQDDETGNILFMGKVVDPTK